MISIHALREEGDPATELLHLAAEEISIHALREEGDVVLVWSRNSSEGFLSTPSARRATRDHGLPVCRRHISIHALREEGDIINTAHACY